MQNCYVSICFAMWASSLLVKSLCSVMWASSLLVKSLCFAICAPKVKSLCFAICAPGVLVKSLCFAMWAIPSVPKRSGEPYTDTLIGSCPEATPDKPPLAVAMLTLCSNLMTFPSNLITLPRNLKSLPGHLISLSSGLSRWGPRTPPD